MYQPTHAATGEVDGILVHAMDVTDQVRNRQQVEELAARVAMERDRFRAFVTATADVIYRMSPDWSEMRRLEGQDFIADTEGPSESWLKKYIYPEDRPRVLAAIADAIRRKGIFELEHRVIRVDGSLGWTLSRAIPILNARGEVVEWFGAARDVTERRQAEDAVQRVTVSAEQERRLYDTILSATPDLVYIFGLDHRFRYANTALLAMWGKTWAESAGKNCLELGYEPWHAAMHDREIEEVIATKRPIRGEVPFNGTGGRRIYDYIFVPVFDERGEVEAVAGTTRDITDRKRKEETLRFLVDLNISTQSLSAPGEIMASTARLLAEHLGVDRCAYAEIENENIFVITGDHSKGVPSIVGRWPVGAFGSECTRCMLANVPYVVADAEHDPRIGPENLPAYQATNICAVICVPLHKDGRFTAAMAVHQTTPRVWTPDEIELVNLVVARCWDALERSQVLRSLQESEQTLELTVADRTAKLRETIGELEAFSYSIAHDLRAPLRSMQGFSDVLLSEHLNQLDAEGQGFLRRIATAAGRMDKLIQDVLNYSRIVRGESPLERVPLELLLRSIVETYPMFAPEKAEIAVEGPVPNVLGNEAMLTQVFSNLFGNAVKFVAPGVKPRIRTWCEPHEEHVRIFVQDNGIGVPEDQREKIFGIFEQADLGYGGTGIGLAIVKKAVERMGGSVGVTSKRGEGSTFWIEVPRA